MGSGVGDGLGMHRHPQLEEAVVAMSSPAERWQCGRSGHPTGLAKRLSLTQERRNSFAAKDEEELSPDPAFPDGVGCHRREQVIHAVIATPCKFAQNLHSI